LQAKNSFACDAAMTTLEELLGTKVDSEIPLMSAGIDSIAATEFTRLLSDKVGIALPATLLFDHPTLSSVSEYLG